MNINANTINLNANNFQFNNDKAQVIRTSFSGAFNLSARPNPASGSNILSYTDQYGSNQTFPVNKWSCMISFTSVQPQQDTLAIDNINFYPLSIGGLWGIYGYASPATVPLSGQNGVTFNAAALLLPVAIATQPGYNGFGDTPPVDPPPQLSTVFGPYIMPVTVLSSIHASTFTLETVENVSINANVAVPTFLGTGNVALNANSNVDIMANYDIIMGADREIDMTGASSITFTSPDIRAYGNTTIEIPGTASIPAVSALAITNGNQYDGAQNYSQIEFQYYGGGFNHYISSRHNANVTYDSGNAIDFWLYSVNTGGDAMTASSAPGIGNTNVMSLTASNVVINRPIQISDSITGGTGTLTVDSGNHLYWNGTLLA